MYWFKRLLKRFGYRNGWRAGYVAHCMEIQQAIKRGSLIRKEEM